MCIPGIVSPMGSLLGGSFGKTGKSIGLGLISPAAGVIHALSGKKKKKAAAASTQGGMTTGGVAGPSPSYYGD